MDILGLGNIKEFDIANYLAARPIYTDGEQVSAITGPTGQPDLVTKDDR
jgi:hypothetical protein